MSKLLELAKAFRRYWLGAYHTMIPRQSYSQNGEDQQILKRIHQNEMDNGIYVEVGGNHPTLINNTFTFYRRGATGIIVEPNKLFAPVYGMFRPKDIFLCIGCAKEPALLEFFNNISSCTSGFVKQSETAKPSAHLPVFPLSELKSIAKGKRVFFMSIDVEGMDFEVLTSAADFLDDVDRVLIEQGDEFDKIDSYLKSRGFEYVFKTEHNSFYERPNIAADSHQTESAKK